MRQHTACPARAASIFHPDVIGRQHIFARHRRGAILLESEKVDLKSPPLFPVPGLRKGRWRAASEGLVLQAPSPVD